MTKEQALDVVKTVPKTPKEAARFKEALIVLASLPLTPPS